MYRVNTLTLRTPALRDHPEDIPALAAHFVAQACRRNHWKPRGLAPDALDLLGRQPWRGNVRELRNVLERALILGDADPLAAADVRAALPAAGSGNAPNTAGAARGVSVPAEGALKDLVDGYEREVIRERLRAMGGHVTNAARSLGLERSHLYKKCRQLGLDIRDDA
jgi:DNA-binding NtrC family response regulator